MTDIGELVVRIKADAAQLERELKRAGTITEQTGIKMKSAFAGVTDAFKGFQGLIATYAGSAFLKGVIDSADKLDEMSEKLGVAVESLSALKYAAKLTGTDIESVSQALKFLGNNVSDAAAGTGAAKDAFKQLGIDAKALAVLPLDEQFERVAEALSGVANQGDRLALVRDIMGKMGGDLLPLLDNFKELKAEAAAVGYVIDSETAQSFAMLNDEVDRFKFGSEVMARNLLQLVVPALNDATAGVNQLFAGLENTSRFFNQLGAGYVALMAKVGAIDQDVADAAYDIAGERIAEGEAARKITPRTPVAGSPSSRKPVDSEQAKRVKDARQALEDYNRALTEEGALLKLSDRERAAQEARFKVEEIARKGSIKLTEEQIEVTAELAANNYDLQKSQEEANKAAQEAIRFQQELHDKLSATLTDVVFKAGSAKEAMLGFAESIARAAFEKKVAGPLADALIGKGGGKGLLDDAIGGIGSLFGGFFADGGRPPVGVPSIVGERGPEIFVPDSAGTVVPNHKLGGQTVIVQQTIQVNPGVPELINAKIREAAPIIAAQAQAGFLSAAEKGGPESQLFRLRS